jgi:hypothetical protein
MYQRLRLELYDIFWARTRAAFDAFINQDKYLSERRGQYAERYGALSPWRGKWDMKLIQDYNFKPSKFR